MQKVPGRVRSVFGSKERLEICWKVVFSFTLFLWNFEIAYAVCESSRSCMLLGRLAYKVMNHNQPISWALKPCNYVFDFAINSIEENLPFVSNFEFHAHNRMYTNLEGVSWCIKAIQATKYPLINFFDFHLNFKDLKWIKSNKIK